MSEQNHSAWIYLIKYVYSKIRSGWYLTVFYELLFNKPKLHVKTLQEVLECLLLNLSQIPSSLKYWLWSYWIATACYFRLMHKKRWNLDRPQELGFIKNAKLTIFIDEKLLIWRYYFILLSSFENLTMIYELPPFGMSFSMVSRLSYFSTGTRYSSLANLGLGWALLKIRVGIIS